MGFQASGLGNSNSRFCNIFSARQRSCWNVYFQSCLSDGQTLHLTIHGPLALPHSGHGTSLYRNPPVWPPPRIWDPLYRAQSPPLVSASDICSFEDPSPTGADIWWLLKHIQLASGWYASLLESLLV